MTYDEFKAKNNGEAKPGIAVTHPIYGRGRVLGLAQGRFAFVHFEVPRSDSMQVMAVSMGVCS